MSDDMDDRMDDQKAEGERQGWFQRLRAGLARSSERLTSGIDRIFVRRRLDEKALEELEELLILADIGPSTAAKLTAELARSKLNRDVTPEEIRTALAEQIAAMLEPVAHPIDIERGHKPHVFLVVGVNGAGKTTTIGKYAYFLGDEGKKVLLAAGDTFRAAAVEQLKVWGERTGAEVLSRPTGADAAGLAFDAMTKAKTEGADILMIDTAGRLHNKANLMSELQKVVRVIGKQDPTAPHETLLVLDATTGQNAHAQVETFLDMVNITGLIVTKLDGTAKGGVLVGLAEKFGLPVHAVGVGEKIDDLRPFDATDFARGLMGLAPH